MTSESISVVFVNINKQGSTVQRKHTKREEKVKLDKEAHQDARQNVKLLLGTKHVLDGNYVIRPE